MMKCQIEVPDIRPFPPLVEGACPVHWANECVILACEEACGRDVFCRDGITQLHFIISDITTGRGRDGDLALLQELCEMMQADSCPLVKQVAEKVCYSLEHDSEEWDGHCRRKRCTALECKDYYSVYIDPAICQGCHDCLKAAPAGAVAFGEGMISVVLEDAALKTPAFLTGCPNGAIKKAGALKPPLPEEPVPIGSFEGAGTRRRRRRGGEEA